MMRRNQGQEASWRLARGEQSLRKGFSLKEERSLPDPRYACLRTLGFLAVAPKGPGPNTREAELRNGPALGSWKLPLTPDS